MFIVGVGVVVIAEAEAETDVGVGVVVDDVTSGLDWVFFFIILLDN
jgi:hypothetical protein